MSENRLNFAYWDLAIPWMEIFGIISRRKQVGVINGIKLIIHANEQGHNKAHLHAQYQSDEVVISIPDGKIIRGNIPAKQQRMASEWVKNNADYLIKCWNDFTNGVMIPAI